MAVAFVSGAQTDPGGGYAPASGTDTNLVWVVGSRRNNENTASAQQFGAAAMVEDHDESNNIAGGADPAAFLTHLVNPGTTSQTLTCTWDVAAPLSEAGYAFTLSGVDQTTPVYPTNGSTTADYTGTDAPSLSYDAPAGSLVVYWRLHAQTTEPSWTDPTNFTARFTNNILASTAYRTLRVWTRAVASAETGSSVAATSDAVGDGGIHGVIVFQPSSSTPNPSISTISTPIVTNTQTTVTGTDFEATQGAGAVTVGGEDVTESSWSDTSVQYTLDIESSVLKYGSHVVELTNNSGNSDTIAQVTNPISTHSYVNIGTPATSGDRITAAGDLATSDQVRYENILYDGVTPTAYGVSVADTGIFTISGGPPDGTYTFEVRVNDGTGWGAAADQTVVINTSGGVGGPSVGGQKMIESTIEPMITNMIED